MSKYTLEDLYCLAFPDLDPDFDPNSTKLKKQNPTLKPAEAFSELLYNCKDIENAFYNVLKNNCIQNELGGELIDTVRFTIFNYYKNLDCKQYDTWNSLAKKIRAKTGSTSQIISRFAQLFKWRLIDELDKPENKIKYVRVDEEEYNPFAPEDEVSASDTSEGYVSVNELGNMFCSREEMSDALEVIMDAFNKLSEKQKIIVAQRAKVMEYLYRRNEQQPLIIDEIISGVEIAGDSFIHSDKDIADYLKKHHPEFNINNVGSISSVMQDVRDAIQYALRKTFGDEKGQEIYNRYKRLGKHEFKRSQGDDYTPFSTI